jgi:beta-N-acetylhexosaminidase
MPRSPRKVTRPQKASTKSHAKLPRDAEAWVRRTLGGMTLEEKVGQLVMVPFFGQFTPAESNEFRDLANAVERQHIGGLIAHTRRGPLGIERSRAYPTAALANLLQERAKVPLLIAGDFERGTAMRLEEGTSFAHAMAVAATGRTEDAYMVGRVTALEARAAGAPWIFAPVADVNSNPENPIINVRSFGEDPKRVGELVAAYVRGVEENGGLATAKHFPGHGDTDVDSHVALPVVASDRAHMERVELAPFRAAIAAGVGSVMTGHLAVPAMEQDGRLPATLSKEIVSGVLRKRMRFDGLVVTDDLSMGGVAAEYTTGDTAVRAILAGSDVLLVFTDLDAALGALREAANSGRISTGRIDESVARILRAKARLGLHKKRHVDLAALPREIARPEFARAAQEIADRGVTLLRDEARLVPLDATRPSRTLLVAIAGDPDPAPGRALEEEIRWRADSLDVLRADTRFKTIDSLSLAAADAYDVTIVALFVRVADRKGSVGLPADQAAFVARLIAAHPQAVVSCFGSPYLVARYPEAKTWLAAFSSADVAQRAVGRALFGEIAISGRIPVTVPGAAKRGDGLERAANPMRLRPAPDAARLKPVWKVLDGAVKDGAFPGGVLAVGHRGELRVRACGRQSYAAGAPKVTPETIYDAASLTKPVVTATLAAMLGEAGALDLDAPVSRYLTEWRTGEPGDARARITVRNLLTHTSGLPAHRDYFQKTLDRGELVHTALAEPVEYEPGTQSVYSDVGFILLGVIIEWLTGRGLDQLASERIFTPLGMKDTEFSPARGLRARIAPTERDEVFRKRVMRGEVHDENAWAMGGVAGHAGMFSTAPDLAVFCQMMLNGGIYAHRRLLRRATVAQFTTPEAAAAGARTLGWMTPTENSSSGRYFSRGSFGHTGFTGSSLWIDPDKELFVVLLTNRVHPTRENEKIKQVRPAVHDAVIEALGLAGGR